MGRDLVIQAHMYVLWKCTKILANTRLLCKNMQEKVTRPRERGPKMAKFYKIDDAVLAEGYGAPAGAAAIEPNTVDAAREKHVPVVTVEGSVVQVVVGGVEHPMEEDHYITFIALETTAGLQMAYLKPGDRPAATFALVEGARAIAAYEYCNKHGLWKAEI